MKTPSVTSVAEKTIKRLSRSLRQKEELQLREFGTVISVGEGFVKVRGLPNAGIDELVRFSNGMPGFVYNLDQNECGIILLDEEKKIDAGDEVYRTGSIVSIPVSESILGRVIDPIGRPLDGGKKLYSNKHLAIERPAPPIMHRAPVQTPLQTGVITIDALFPIGRGQRELILGDRQTGKTAIAVDTIINQYDKDVICIYCGIGKQKAAVARVIADLRKRNAMDYTIVLSATSEDPVGLQYIAPYAATSIAEYFMERGRDVLIVYDDLTWHARAYRELALLLRRPPGREAYPGDIFYIHSRLLERSTKLKPEHGGGSLTALPIIETQAQNISAFIPTNLISITDGQIYLSPELFRKDVLPAIDAGNSVSRVGGSAQLPAYRSVSKKLRLAYSQFEEMEAFSRFSSRLDESTRQLIERGKRIRETLKQPQFDPLRVDEQVVLLLAVTQGLFDNLHLDEIEEAKNRIRQAVQSEMEKSDISINWDKELKDKERERLLGIAQNAIQTFKEEKEEGEGEKETEEPDAETGTASAQD
ncbi:alternate F1F0 ATPase, F1 subunit alpha [Rhodohalobacter mucosus]|uniref:ATP synthase subunit alpha n=1 Tax=Rhodohalobacter mucosus TaxID=2079485 RepID=A0A316TSP5_9BACT|nr:alternate F1F0 ATPase, F1 subunit alpha [Rhodohalobacter mucosus]PWN05985.1 F0F1 ATP synthase subunit alpha [Rhodohalobacter mucosus]